MIPQGYSYVRIKAHPLSNTLMHKKLQMPSRFPFIMRLTSYCFNPAIVNSNYTEADKSQEVIKGWSSDLQRTSKSRVSAECISWQLIHCTCDFQHQPVICRPLCQSSGCRTPLFPSQFIEQRSSVCHWSSIPYKYQLGQRQVLLYKGILKPCRNSQNSWFFQHRSISVHGWGG